MLKLILLIILASIVSTQMNLFVDAENGKDAQNTNSSPCSLVDPLCTEELPCKTLACALEHANKTLGENNAQDVIITLIKTSDPTNKFYTLSNKKQKNSNWLNFNGTFILKGDTELDLTSIPDSGKICSQAVALNLQYFLNDPFSIIASNGVIIQDLNINVLLANLSFNIYNSAFSMQNICLNMGWSKTMDFIYYNYDHQTEEEEINMIYSNSWYKMINLEGGSLSDGTKLDITYNFTNIIISYEGWEFYVCDNVVMLQKYYWCFTYYHSALIAHNNNKDNQNIPTLYFSNIILNCDYPANYFRFFYSQFANNLILNGLNSNCFPAFQIATSDVNISNVNISGPPGYSYDFLLNGAMVFDLIMNGSLLTIENVVLDNLEIGVCYDYEECQLAINYPLSIISVHINIYNNVQEKRTPPTRLRLLDENMNKVEFEFEDNEIIRSNHGNTFANTITKKVETTKFNKNHEQYGIKTWYPRLITNEEAEEISIFPNSLPDLSKYSIIPWDYEEDLEEQFINNHVQINRIKPNLQLIDGVYDTEVTITLKNITISNNNLYPSYADTFFSFIYITASECANTSRINLQNIAFINNSGISAYQNYGFRLYDIDEYYLNNINYSNNFVSRFAAMGTKTKQLAPIVSMSNIIISNNNYSLINNESSKYDTYLVDDPTMGVIDLTISCSQSNILLTDINIENNDLASTLILKIQNPIVFFQFMNLYTFLSNIYIKDNKMYTGTFISITGFHLYVDNLTIIGNDIENSNLLDLSDQTNQINAFVVQNSTFINNILTNSMLLQKIMDLDSAYIYLQSLANLVLPFWITVSNCTFQNLQLNGISVGIQFSSVPFGFIYNNTFSNINISQGAILVSGSDLVTTIAEISKFLMSSDSFNKYIDSYTARIFNSSTNLIHNLTQNNDLELYDSSNTNEHQFITRIAFNTFDTLFILNSHILNFENCLTNHALLSIDHNNIKNINISTYDDDFIFIDSVNLIDISYNDYTLMKGDGYIMVISSHLRLNIYRNTITNNIGSSLLTITSEAEKTILNQNIIKNVYSNFTFVSLLTHFNQGIILFKHNIFINITIKDNIYTYQQINFFNIEIYRSTGSLLIQNNIFANIAFIKNHPLVAKYDNSFIIISNPDDDVQIYDTIFFNISILYDNNLLTVVGSSLDLKRTTISLIYNYDIYGSLYYLGNNLSIYQCNFQYNYAYNGQGGAIFVDKDDIQSSFSIVSIKSSYFRNNFALIGSTFFYGGKTIQFEMQNNTFYQGYVTSFDNQYIVPNTQLIYGIIAFSEAILKNCIVNSTILYSNNNLNGFIFLEFMAIGTISTISNDSSTFTISNFDINLSNDTFLAVDINGCLKTQFILNTISIKPNNATFYNISLLNTDSADIFISNLYLNTLILYQSFMKVTCNSKNNASLTITNSSFSNFSIPILGTSFGIVGISSIGSSHYCYQSLSIIDTIFSNISIGLVADWTQDYSTIYVDYPGNATIYLSRILFQFITSIRGPGLTLNNWPISPSTISTYLKGIKSSSKGNDGIKTELLNIYYYYDTNITIDNCTFNNNTAYLEGGSIYNTYNNISILNTIFEYNQAQYRTGGAIFSSNLHPFNFALNVSNNNQFISNKRYSQKYNGTYLDQASLGTPPIEMNITLEQSNNSFANIVYYSSNNSFLISNVTSNELKEISFIIGLKDDLGQIFYESPSGDPELSSTLTNMRLIKMISNISSTSTSDCDFANCYINETTFTLKGIAGTNIIINFTYQSIENIVPNVTMTVILRSCNIGEINSSNIAGSNPAESICTLCPPKLYSLNLSDPNCNSCNFGDAASCLGGSNLIIAHGYWRPNNLSDQILLCPNGLSCVGGADSECTYGYTGPLCQSCNGTAKFARSGPNMCGSCPDKTQQISLAILFAILLIIHQLYMIRSSLLENIAFYEAKMTVKDEQAKIQGQYLRLLTTYGQIISLVLTFKLEYPNFIHESVGNISKSPTNTIFSSTLCFLLDLNYSPDQLIFSQIVLVSFIPIAKIIAITILLIIVLNSCKRKIDNATRKAYFIISIFCVILVEQPGLFNYLVSYLTCIQYNNGDKYVLLQDYAVECFTPQYNYYLVLLVIPNLLVWGFLIPAILFLILCKNRRNLSNKLLRLNLGGIYNDYKDSAYFWGIVLMIMKLLLMFTASVLYNDIKTEALTIFIIILIYLVGYIKIKPIKREEIHKTELLATVSYLSTIFFAIYYKDNKYFACQIVAILIMGAVNFYVIALIVFKIVMLNARYIPCVKKYAYKENNTIILEAKKGEKKPEDPADTLDENREELIIHNSNNSNNNNDNNNNNEDNLQQQHQQQHQPTSTASLT